MSLFDKLRPAHALTNLLEKERVALLAGNFADLQKLGANKEALMKSVARSKPSQKEIVSPQKLTNRNRRLLIASSRGVRSAQMRIAKLRAKPAALNTYGPSGGITSIDDKPLTIKKKA